jgi:hypothetical protein
MRRLRTAAAACVLGGSLIGVGTLAALATDIRTPAEAPGVPTAATEACYILEPAISEFGEEGAAGIQGECEFMDATFVPTAAAGVTGATGTDVKAESTEAVEFHESTEAEAEAEADLD